MLPTWVTMAVYHYDQTYMDVARRYNSGNRLCFAVGGDSHGIRLWQQFLESDTRFVFPNLAIYDEKSFGVSGGLARTYGTHRGSVNMCGRNRLQNFHIVVLMIGSNDPDQHPGTTSAWQITRDIESIVKDLTRKGQIVYVVQIPSRHTFRSATATDYCRINRSIGHKLSRMLKNRYIHLPPRSYQREAFARETYRGRLALVHLTSERYSDLADGIFRHIDNDLQNFASMPSSLSMFNQ